MPPEIFLSDVGEPEGPAFGPDNAFYLVEMAGDRGCVTCSIGGKTTRVAKTAGRPNGLAVDGEGNIWIAEARDGTVICLDPSGKLLRTIAGDDDGRFLWPNDLAFGPDGLLYMTDSGIIDTDFIDGLAIRSDYADIPYDGRVYQIDPIEAKVLRTLDRGFRFTNGIAFDQAGLLYVTETLSGAIFRYDLSKANPTRAFFTNVLSGEESRLFRGPDGIAFDERGLLYCAIYNEGRLTVVDRSGAVVDRIPTLGSRPTNLAFQPDGTAMYVTEVETSSVQIIDVGCRGLPLHYPKLAR